MAGIIYLLTNTINGKQYVGQTTDEKFDARMRAHKYPHKRTAIQHAVRKYGWNAFTTTILETSNQDISEREKFWIAKLNTVAPTGYNLTTGGESGKQYDKTSRRKMSEHRRRVLSDPNKMTQWQQAAERGRRALWREGQREKFIDSCSRLWLVKFPDGHTETIQNMNQFCRENDLHAGTMSQVAKGIHKQHKGFSCLKVV